LQLYFKDHDPAMLAPIRQRMDTVMQLPDNPEKPLWWWCDALFMAPPVLAELYKATGDRAYLDFMDHEWSITSAKLYSPENHLFFRDAGYIGKQESNGKPVFWSRGNGWVLAGLARVLTYMPSDYTSRDRYVVQSTYRRSPRPIYCHIQLCLRGWRLSACRIGSVSARR